MTEIWADIENFTSRENAYYGQEMLPILVDMVTGLLDRMRSEMSGEMESDPIKYLTLQINSSYYATEVMDHLITNDAQWDQLINVLISYKH